MQTPYATTTRHATRLATSQAVTAYLASGGTVKRYATGLRALPIAAINQAVATGRKPSFYCIHQPINSGEIKC